MKIDFLQGGVSMTSVISSVWRYHQTVVRMGVRYLALVILCLTGGLTAHGAEWSALGTGLDGSVNAMACDSAGNLYAGGYFITADEETVNYIAKWDGAEWSALGTGMNGPVFAIGIDSNDNLYAGGAYTTAGRGFCKWYCQMGRDRMERTWNRSEQPCPYLDM